MTTLLLISHIALALITFALVIEQDKRSGQGLSFPWLAGYFIAAMAFWPALLGLWIIEHFENKKENGGGE